VLVVDDDDLQRDVLAEVLASAGYAVVVAADGVAALEVARASTPDLVVLDLLMPRLDGASVLAELRRDPALASVPVVVTTGVQTSHVRRLLGADATLFKPFDVRELLETVGTFARRA
jgi:CheY-like chemotaxis protein